MITKKERQRVEGKKIKWSSKGKLLKGVVLKLIPPNVDVLEACPFLKQITVDSFRFSKRKIPFPRVLVVEDCSSLKKSYYAPRVTKANLENGLWLPSGSVLYEYEEDKTILEVRVDTVDITGDVVVSETEVTTEEFEEKISYDQISNVHLYFKFDILEGGFLKYDIFNKKWCRL